jgi:hypothetical protein
MDELYNEIEVLNTIKKNEDTDKFNYPYDYVPEIPSVIGKGKLADKY